MLCKESFDGVIGKLCLSKWKDICNPIAYGGLGIRHLENINEFMLTKLVRRVVSNPDSLLARGKGWWNPMSLTQPAISHFSDGAG